MENKIKSLKTAKEIGRIQGKDFADALSVAIIASIKEALILLSENKKNSNKYFNI